MGGHYYHMQGWVPVHLSWFVKNHQPIGTQWDMVKSIFNTGGSKPSLCDFVKKCLEFFLKFFQDRVFKTF